MDGVAKMFLLKRIRLLKGLSVREVARISGLSAATISRTERFPRTLRVIALIEILRAYEMNQLANLLKDLIEDDV